MENEIIPDPHTVKMSMLDFHRGLYQTSQELIDELQDIYELKEYLDVAKSSLYNLIEKYCNLENGLRNTTNKDDFNNIYKIRENIIHYMKYGTDKILRIHHGISSFVCLNKIDNGIDVLKNVPGLSFYWYDFKTGDINLYGQQYLYLLFKAVFAISDEDVKKSMLKTYGKSLQASEGYNNKTLRLVVVEELGSCGSVESVQTLMDIMKDDTNDQVKRRASHMLSVMC